MSLPDRNNPYSFEDYLSWRTSLDYYQDDSFVQQSLKTFAGPQWDKVDAVAREVSKMASYRWRDLADEAARPENKPYLIHYNAHNRRIDRVVRSRATELMEQEVFAQAIFSDTTSSWEKFINMFLIYQNGEACISCPMTCTDGMVALLDQYADDPELERVRMEIKQGVEGRYAIGAQYISEIQGGSDIPANLLEAIEQNGGWRLYGKKFFCSATHADYSVVTAKPAGSDKLAAFIVPSWLPGDKNREQRNGYTIDRMKWKMGTSELPTCEINFQGALAYPIGALDQGLSIVVGIVLAYSRLTIGIFSAAVMTRAVREAKKYAEFRTAFGQSIGQFPMLAGQLDDMQKVAQRTTAGVFKYYQQVLTLDGGLAGVIMAVDSIAARRQQFEIRELTMLQKIFASRDSVNIIQNAISVFGGHGVIEDFSSLPRLFRDAMVNELWEGPKNVLLAQIHSDFQSAGDWYPATEFVASLLAGADAAIINPLQQEIKDLVACPSLNKMDAETIELCRRWDLCCERLFHAYQDLALIQVEKSA